MYIHIYFYILIKRERERARLRAADVHLLQLRSLQQRLKEVVDSDPKNLGSYIITPPTPSTKLRIRNPRCWYQNFANIVVLHGPAEQKNTTEDVKRDRSWLVLV